MLYMTLKIFLYDAYDALYETLKMLRFLATR